MEGAAKQAKKFRRDKIQSSSNPGHQISRNKAGNQDRASNQDCTPVLI